jgi:acetylornithine deacetylase
MNTSIKNLFFDSVDESRDEIVSLLKKLVRFPTTTGNERDAQLYYAALMEQEDFETEVWEPDLEEIKRNFNIVTSRTDYKNSPLAMGLKKGAGGGKSIILSGHMDVVPVGDFWKYDPFGAEEENGRIYGRGAADMKAGLTANYTVARLLKKNNIQLKGDLYLQSCIDEETGSTGVLGAVLKGYKADGLIVSEPTNRNILIATIGATWFRIVVRGKSAHASATYNGVNAIQKACLFVEKLNALELKRAENIESEIYRTKKMPYCINVGCIQSGNWPSTVPDKAIIEGRFGFAPSETLDDVRSMLNTVIDEVCEADDWLKDHRPEMELYGTSWHGAELDADFPLVQLLSKHCDQIYGQKTTVDAASFCTDGAMMSRFANTPAVTFGPGNIAVAHETNEYVEIEEILSATKAIGATVLDWCGIAE